MRILFLATLILSAGLAGCTSNDDGAIRVAFVSKDTALEPHAHPDRLAHWMEEETGRPAEAFFFSSSTAALAAVASGQADFASVDGAAGWLAWKQLGLEAIASELRSDGATFYTAAAWVRDDSDIMTVDDLAGVTSCHTGATKSAGMMMPMSFLVREGFIDASAYADDISQLQEMAKDFFDAPIIGGAYAGYEGGLRCLSDGTGDVAFIRDSTPADYCADDATGRADRDWCLDLADYRKLVDFGPVPEHPIMIGDHLDDEMEADILAALLALNDSGEGMSILDEVFGTHGIAAVASAEAHLGGYGDLIQHLPGIEAYAEAK